MRKKVWEIERETLRTRICKGRKENFCKCKECLEVFNQRIMSSHPMHGVQPIYARAYPQAHMQARFCILRVLLEAGQDFVTITPDEEKGVTVSLDRSKILEVGIPAVGAFLRKIQIYKSTADFEAAKAMYMDNYSHVPADMLALRDIVLAKKKERPLFVQPHLELVPTNGAEGEHEVQLKTFPATMEGVIQSFQARFPAFDEEMLALWRKDREATVPVYLAGGMDGSEKKRHKTENGDRCAAVTA